MGIYIEVPHHLNKAEQLMNLHGAVQTLAPDSLSDISPDKYLICVVENGLFDAAAVTYSQREMEAFKHPDGRPRTWLLMDEEKVNELTRGAAAEAREEALARG